MVAVGCESPGSFACCVKFLCYLMLLYTAADQRSRIRLSAGSMTRSRQTFSIPMWLSKPFWYSCCVHLIMPWTQQQLPLSASTSLLSLQSNAQSFPETLPSLYQLTIPSASLQFQFIHNIFDDRNWTYFKCNQDLSCNYIEMKFRIYPVTKF